MTRKEAREAIKEAYGNSEYTDEIIKALEQEPKIKVLDRDEVIRKLGTVDIYKANAWITLLKDLEYLELKICEVKK